MDPFSCRNNSLHSRRVTVRLPAWSVAVLPPYGSAVYFYCLTFLLCIFIVYLTFTTLCGSGGVPWVTHTRGWFCPPQTVPGVLWPWDTSDRQRGRERWPKEDRICQDSAETHGCVCGWHLGFAASEDNPELPNKASQIVAQHLYAHE